MERFFLNFSFSLLFSLHGEHHQAGEVKILDGLLH